MPRLLLRRVCAALVCVSAVVCLPGQASSQPLRKIGELRLALVGLTATVDPGRPSVPKNIASGVRIRVQGGGQVLAPATVAQLLGAFRVEGDLAGPALSSPVPLRVDVTTANAPNELILPLPALAIAGAHTLSNLRLVGATGQTLLDLQPATVALDVIDQVLVTSVVTRALTLQEIKDKGIVLDSDDYLGFEFTLAMKLESTPINVSFPVVFDRNNVAIPLPTGPPAIVLDAVQVPIAIPTVIPMMLSGVVGGQPVKLGDGSLPRIPSVLVIPGDVGYLKQFFSAQLFVGNGTPASAQLDVTNITATMLLPTGADTVPGNDDPLSPADTVNGPQQPQMPVVGMGPDGVVGTADDVVTLAAGQQGQAEFLVRGDLEGYHTLAFDIDANLVGLPTGPVKIKGRATGGVLVRNPFFDVSFTAPAVVRQNEPFRLYATITNKGQGVANAVSMTLDQGRMAGLRLVGSGTQTVATIAPGDAQVVAFDFVSNKTGEVVTTYLNFNGAGATGSLNFTIGVGEQGIRLSPDTLVLPAQVSALPMPVVDAAMRVLGQAWSIANTPANLLPSGVTRISKAIVTQKALALAEAGLRVSLGQPALTAIRDLAPDFHGGVPFDPGFDQLLRHTDAGRDFAFALGAALAPAAASSAASLEREFAVVAASGTDFVSLSVDGTTGMGVSLTDAGGRRTVLTGAPTDPRPAVRSAVLLPLGAPGAAPVFGLVAAPTAGPYTLWLGGTAGAADVSVTYPRGDGTFTRGFAAGVLVSATGATRLVIDPARATPAVEHDSDGDGVFEGTHPLTLEGIAASAPRFLAAAVIGPETLPTAGPYGLNVAFLFDRVVSATSADNKAAYSLPNNSLFAVKRQLSGRLAFGALRAPEGPYVSTTVTVTGMRDLRGATGGTETQPLASRLLDPGAVVSGTVYNGDGTPAAGVGVFYSNGPRDCQISTDADLARLVTDAAGHYEVRFVHMNPCGRAWTMTANDPVSQSLRTASGRVRTAGERIQADIALLGRGHVSGVVRDLGGQPVSGAQVVAVSTLEPQSGGQTTTDGQGRYSIYNLVVGPVGVKAGKGVVIGSAAGQIARAGLTATVDVILDSGAVQASGVVRRLENGIAAVVPNVPVVYRLLQGGHRTAVGVAYTNTSGVYQFTDMPAGAYVLEVQLSNLDRAEVAGVAAAGDTVTKDLTVLVTRNATVSGVVQFPDGSPVPNPVVAISGTGAAGSPDGTFTVSNVQVQPTPQVLAAYANDGSRTGTASVLVNQSGQNVTGVVVTMNGLGTLQLTVVDGNGAPVPNQQVLVTRAATRVLSNPCLGVALGTTNTAGLVVFPGLDVGTISVKAVRQAIGFVDVATLDTVIARDGDTASAVLRFGGVGTVTGQVLDGTGQPVFGADVELTSRRYDQMQCALTAGVSHTVRTGADGRFTVPNVTVGPVGVGVSHAFLSPKPVWKSGVLVRHGDTLPLDVRLVSTIAGKITGTVVLPDGATAAGAGVQVSVTGILPEVTVVTDARGGYALPEVFPEGFHEITARDPVTGGVVRERIFLRAAEQAVHDLRLKGRGTVRVTVVDGASTPVSQALVRLRETEFPFAAYDAVLEAANQGVAVFSQVYEGPFSVEASDVFGRGGRLSARLPGPGADFAVTVPLTVTGTVRGRFLLPDGVTSIPYGSVRLVANNKVIGQATTLSGTDVGLFEFRHVPAGNVRLEALDPATGRAGVGVGTLVTDGQVLLLDVRAQGLGTVRGVVTSNGQAAPTAHVEVVSGTFKAGLTVDGSGAYLVPGVPEGAVTVTADLNGALKGVTTASFSGDGTTVTIDVALRDSGTVTGRVTESDGTTAAPPSLVSIRVGVQGESQSTTTDATGAYRFDRVAAGAASITVDVLGTIDTAVVQTTVVGGNTVDVPIALLGVGSLTGTAFESVGVPTDGTITITGTGLVPYSLTLTVGANGVFSAPRVLAGPFTARLSRRQGTITLVGTATGVIAPGMPTTLDVLLQPSGTLVGRVLRSDGATPALGAAVTVRNGSLQVVTTSQAATNGLFTASGVPLGTYTLDIVDASSNGYARASGAAVATAGQLVDIGTLVLDDTTMSVVAIAPADGTTNAARTTPVVVDFSDPLSAGTLHGVQVMRGTSPVAGVGRTLSPDGRSLTLTPTASGWPDASTLTVAVTTQVTDIYGRRLMQAVTSQFTTVDVSAPTVTVLAPANDALQVQPSSDVVVTFSEPLDVSTDLVGLITLTGPSGPVTGATTQTAPTIATFVPAAPLADNARYTVRIVGARDSVGNVQTSPHVTSFATVDTVAPLVTPNAPASAAWTVDNRPVLSAVLLDTVSGTAPASGTVHLDGVVVPPILQGNTLLQARPAAPIADGTHTVLASVADRVGNVGSATWTFSVDTAAPSAPLLAGVVEGQTLRGTITVSATATDTGSGVQTIELRRNGNVVLTLAAPAFSAPLNTTSLGEGPSTLTATAVDAAGNRSVASAPIAVRVDNQPIVVSIGTPAVGTRVRDTVSVTASVSEPVASVTFTIGVASVTDTTLPYAATLDLSGVPEGAAVLNVTATGLAGDSGSSARNLIVDRTPPAAPDATRIAAEPPTAGVSIVRGSAGSVEANATVEIRHVVTQQVSTTTASSTGTFLSSISAAIDDTLSVVAIDAVGNRSAATSVVVRSTPSVPPIVGATTLRFDGLLADRVSLASGGAGLAPDGTPDAVFTSTVDVGAGITRQLTFVDLEGPTGSRSTRVGVGPVVGVTGEIGSPLANAANGTVSGAVTGATSFTLFVADGGFLVDDGFYTVTFGFSDGSRFVGTLQRIPPHDVATVAHSATITAVPGSTVVGTAGSPGTITLQLTNIRDINGTRVPDGARVALAVANAATNDPRGVAMPSAGGELLDGLVATNDADFKVYTVVNGATTATFSTGTVVPPVILGTTTVVQMLAADAVGNVLGHHAVATLDLNLRAPTDTAIVTADRTSIYAEGVERRIPVRVQVPLTDGAIVAVTAQANRTFLGSTYIASAGGQIVGGVASQTSGFQAFVVTGGHVQFEYSTNGAGASAVGHTRRAVIQVVLANASGAVANQTAIGTSVITLAGPGAAEFQTSAASIPLVQPAQTAQVVVHHVHDARANLVPDGAEFLATAQASRTFVGSSYVNSAGGTILNGQASSSSGFRRFTLAQGQFVVSYTTDPVAASPGQVQVANVQVAQAGIGGVLGDITAVAVTPLRLVAPLNASGAASPSSLLADGAVHTSTVTFGPILDAYGNTVPDGTLVAASAAPNAAFSGGSYVPSAGGQIVDGAPSPTANHKVFAVSNGAVSLTYADQNLTREPGQIGTANVALLAATATGTVQSLTPLGIVPIALAGATSASVTTSPSALYADGADRRATVTVTNIRDALGVPVPDGTMVQVTAANNASFSGGSYISSAGGQIVGGTAAPGNPSHRVFQVQGGQIVLEYSTVGATVSGASERTAVVQVVPARPDGTRISILTLGTAAIRLVPLGAANGTATPSAIVTDAGDRRTTVRVTGLVGQDGVTALPDGARVALTVANNTAFFGGSYMQSAGGDLLDAGHATGDGAAVPSDARFRLFTVTGGEVRASYRALATAGGVNDSRVARVSIVPVDAAGNVLTISAAAVVPVGLNGVTSTTASGPSTATIAGGPVQVTFGGIKDAAGNTVPDGYLVAVTAAASQTTNQSGQFAASIGGTIVDGTTLTADPDFKVFPVMNGAVTLTYQPTVTGVAQIQIAPLKADQTFFNNRALVGGWFPITVTP